MSEKSLFLAEASLYNPRFADTTVRRLVRATSLQAAETVFVKWLKENFTYVGLSLTITPTIEDESEN